jgi:hypothetical protein
MLAALNRAVLGVEVRMSYQRNTDMEAALSRSQAMKGWFAGVISLLCIAFVIWIAWPKPEPIIAPPTDNVAKWQEAFGQVSQEHAKKIDAVYKVLGKVTALPSEDRQSIIVTGRVASAAEFGTLKAELEKIQPPVTLDWKVTVGQ